METLLKYPLSFYRSGDLELAWPWSAWLLVSLVLTLAMWRFAGYGAATAPPRRERIGMTLLRGALLALVLLLLLQPVLVVPLAVTQRAQLLVLVDESRSMSIADADGIARSERVAALLREDGLLERLEDRFQVERHAYATGLRRLAPGQAPGSQVARSNLAGALSALADGAARARPAGVVLISDGGLDDEGLDTALLTLRSRGVPVHVLGVGETRVAPDADLLLLRVPTRVFAQDSIDTESVIAANGLAGARARLTLLVDGVERARAEVVLPADGEHRRVRLPLEMPAAGSVRVEAILAPSPGERLQANNHAGAVVAVLANAAPVLHYEGEPRFEVKFLRRAVSEDEALSLVSLVRTAENKFYRLGVASEDELADGFPVDAADLYRFAVVVLGARAAAALDEEGQALLEAFVAERGGALVLLEGTAAGGALERLSPLPPPRAAQTPAVVRVRAAPAAAAHPLTGFLVAPGAGAAPLHKLPALTLARRARTAKPGARTLLLGDDGGADPLVVLAEHRYGRGRVVAFAVRDSWRWQMHADVGPHDQTHERLWRQMLRWLARETPSRTTLVVSSPVAVPGAPVNVSLTLREADWQPQTGAPPALRVTTPLGDQFDLQTRRSATPGRYDTDFVPDGAGLWEIRFDGDAASAAPATHWLEVDADGREFHRPGLDETLLRGVGETTGGSYRPLARADELLAVLQPAPSMQGSLRRLPLWDVPAVLVLLLLLATAEWGWRRLRRLP